MSRAISDKPIGNLFSERQSLVVTKNGANYYKKVLVPFAKYILQNEDTSNYRDVNSELTNLIWEHYYNFDKTKEDRHEIFWSNASSLIRILPIIYFENVYGNIQIRLTDLARANYEGKIKNKEFLLLWILRFQGSEYSNKGVLTKSSASILENCDDKKYRNLLESRKVKPGILALDILYRVKKEAIPEITDKQYRHARRLLDQENQEAMEELTNIIIKSECNDGSQEDQVFNVLRYLGLCSVLPNKTNNKKYSITGLGEAIIEKINSLPFIYYNIYNSTEDFIDYYGGMPNKFEKEIIDYYIKNGGNFNE